MWLVAHARMTVFAMRVSLRALTCLPPPAAGERELAPTHRESPHQESLLSQERTGFRKGSQLTRSHFGTNRLNPAQKAS